MPKTFPTTVAPMPTDRRVLQLEQMLNVSRSQAVGVVVMSWAWMLAEESDGVVQGEPKILDSLVNIDGAGQSLVDAGLVGVEPAGLVLPLGVRHVAERATKRGESAEDRKRRKANERKQKSRKHGKLASPSQASGSKTGSLTAEAARSSQSPRCLGYVEGCPVMLLYNARQGVPFYTFRNATPKEWTASVTDPQRPSLADALVSLHGSMKREAAKGLHADNAFSPSLEQMVAAAQREKDSRQATAAEAARRDQANNAFLEAAAEDQEDAAEDAPERDVSRSGHTQKRDSVTCHASVTLCETETLAANPCGGNDLDAENEGAKCHAFGHTPAPSSSISLCLSSPEEFEEKDTTTSVAAHAERDPADDTLDRFLDRQATTADGRRQEDPERAKLRERDERFAAALKTTKEAVSYQRQHDPAVLLARLKAAGINPKTGLPAGAHHEPADARNNIGMTTEPAQDAEPAAGIAGARGAGEPDDAEGNDIPKVKRLRRSCGPLLAAQVAGAGFRLKLASDISAADAAEQLLTGTQPCPMSP